MILGVSHIVLTSTDLERDKAGLESAGWQTKFTHTGIPTHPGKRPYMSTLSAEQGIVFMQPPGGTAVELIHYSDRLADTTLSPLQIVLPGKADERGLDGLTCELQFQNPAPSPSRITHHVTDLARAERFWCHGLGFKPSTAAEAEDTRLDFDSPIPAWRASLSLVLCDGPETPAVVDGPGFRCISLLCNDLARDGDRIRSSGATGSTGVMNLSLNGNELDLELFAGPDGAIVELCKVIGKTNP